jgi:FlaA1/EpsC-like NDP-sugar epimerase
MKSLIRKSKIFVIRIFNGLFCILSSFFSLYINQESQDTFLNSLVITSVFSILLIQTIFLYYKNDLMVIKYIGLYSIKRFIKAFIIYSCLFFIIFSIYKIENISRLNGVLQPCILFIGLGGIRYIYYYLIKFFENNNVAIVNDKENIMIYGAGRSGRNFASLLQVNESTNILGFLDDNNSLHGGIINGLPVFDSKMLPKLIDDHKLKKVFFSIKNISYLEKKEIIQKLTSYGLKIKDARNFKENDLKLVDFKDLDHKDFLIGRQPIDVNLSELHEIYYHKIILITGAGGSIGSELARLCFNLHPKKLILLDCDEYRLHLIYEELKGYKNENTEVAIIPSLVSLINNEFLSEIFKEHNPEIVFHAAAYKHVPMIECNPISGILNNVFGTINCLENCIKFDCRKFVLISSDKAVRPTNVMGATKRVSEMLVQAYREDPKSQVQNKILSIVRFGNVIGSSGSVVPLFMKQISNGGPITLTHPDVMRFFMTIPEAAHLVMHSLLLSSDNPIFLLDMGNPVKIYDLAEKMINMHGFSVKNNEFPNGDIEIKFTGLRSGEKMVEELVIDGEIINTTHPKILALNEKSFERDVFMKKISELKDAIDLNRLEEIYKILELIVEGYKYPHMQN